MQRLDTRGRQGDEALRNVLHHEYVAVLHLQVAQRFAGRLIRGQLAVRRWVAARRGVPCGSTRRPEDALDLEASEPWEGSQKGEELLRVSEVGHVHVEIRHGGEGLAEPVLVLERVRYPE